MFDVIDNEGNRLTVYGIHGAHFLIFQDDPADYGWRYIPMSQCVPAIKSER